MRELIRIQGAGDAVRASRARFHFCGQFKERGARLYRLMAINDDSKMADGAKADLLDDELRFTTRAISTRTGLSVVTVRKLIRDGTLPSIKVSPRRRAVGSKALREYLRQLNEPREAVAATV